MNKIVVAIDSFKGILSSREADEAAEQGIKTIFPQCEVLHFPVADGGEGILEILTDAFHGHTVPLVAHNPLMQKITTQFGISEDGRTALVEMARLIPSMEDEMPWKTFLTSASRTVYIFRPGTSTNSE